MPAVLVQLPSRTVVSVLRLEKPTISGIFRRCFVQCSRSDGKEFSCRCGNPKHEPQHIQLAAQHLPALNLSKPVRSCDIRVSLNILQDEIEPACNESTCTDQHPEEELEMENNVRDSNLYVASLCSSCLPRPESIPWYRHLTDSEKQKIRSRAQNNSMFPTSLYPKVNALIITFISVGRKGVWHLWSRHLWLELPKCSCNL